VIDDVDRGLFLFPATVSYAVLGIAMSKAGDPGRIYQHHDTASDEVSEGV